jgi:hypothetical protein
VDVETWDKSRRQIYAELAALAGEAGADAAQVAAKLQPNPDGVAKGEKNMGTCVKPTMAQTAKFHRKRGVHVTPTVFVNGVEATDVSSAWTGEQFTTFLAGFKA